MSYPPPPGLPAKPPQHASLPARPPPSTVSPAPAVSRPQNGGFKPAFTSFAPRTVAAAQPFRTASPAHYSAPPVTSYSSGPQTSYSSTPQYSAPPQDAYQAQPAPQYPGAESYAQPAAPQIKNPFVPTGATATSTNTQPAYDPELEAQIQQWQSAYMGGKDDKPSQSYASRTNPLGPTGANNAPLGASSRVETSSPAVSAPSNTHTPSLAGNEKTVVRSGGGKEWTDSTLLEWDPAHFRIFVGNLAGEVTDESLLKAFAKYTSVQKARVIRDKRTTKSKGYGFVSFSDGDDYFQAARDMQGKYIGSHPVLIKRAQTEVKASGPPQHGKNRNKGKGGGGFNGKTEHGGVQKKVPKTKGGLKVLG